MANPKPIRVPVSAFRSYNKRMRAKILRPLFDDFARGLRQAQSISQAYSSLSVVSLTQAQWDEAIAAGVDQHAEAVEQFHRRKFIRSFRSALGVNVSDIIDEGIAEWLTNYRRENIALIKTIPERAHDGLFNAMSKQFAQRPFDQKELMELLNTQYQSSGYNLRRLTRDQTNKAIGQLTEVRQKNAGVRKYIWRTSGDERVREAHNSLGGTMQRWDRAPSTGHPGIAIQCRCSAEAVIDDEAIQAAKTQQRTTKAARAVTKQRTPRTLPFGRLAAFKGRSPGLDNGVARTAFDAKHPAFDLDPDLVRQLHFDHPKFAALDTYSDEAQEIIGDAYTRKNLNNFLIDLDMNFIDALNPTMQRHADELTAAMKQFEPDDLPLLFHSTGTYGDDLVEGALVKLEGFSTASPNPTSIGGSDGRIFEIHAPNGVKAIMSPSEASFILDRNQVARVKAVYNDVDVPNVGKVKQYAVVELEAPGVKASPFDEVPFKTKNDLPAFVAIEDGFTPPRPDSPLRRRPRVDLDNMPDETGRLSPEIDVSSPSDWGDDLKWKQRDPDYWVEDFQQQDVYRAEFFGSTRSDRQVLSQRQAQLIVDDIAHSAGIEPYKVMMLDRADRAQAHEALKAELIKRGSDEGAASHQAAKGLTGKAMGVTYDNTRIIVLWDSPTIQGMGYIKDTVLHEAAHMVAEQARRLDEVVINAAKLRGQTIPSRVAQRFDEGACGHGTVFADTVTDVRQLWAKRNRDDLNQIWREWKVQSSDVRPPGFQPKQITPIYKVPTDRRPRGSTFRVDQPRGPPPQALRTGAPTPSRVLEARVPEPPPLQASAYRANAPSGIRADGVSTGVDPRADAFENLRRIDAGDNSGAVLDPLRRTHFNLDGFVSKADEPAGLKSYRRSSVYEKFNKRAREGKLSDADKAMEQDMLSVTKKFTDEDAPLLYRGAIDNSSYNEGGIYTFDSWTSTSTEPYVSSIFVEGKARRGATSKFFEIHGGEGMRGIVYNQDEMEVLLQRGTKFRVEKVHKNVKIDGLDRGPGIAQEVNEYIVVRILDDTPATARPVPAPKPTPKSTPAPAPVPEPTPVPVTAGADPDADRIQGMIDEWASLVAARDVQGATQAKSGLRKAVSELSATATNAEDAKRFTRMRNSLSKLKPMDGPTARIRSNLTDIQNRPGRTRATPTPTPEPAPTPTPAPKPKPPVQEPPPTPPIPVTAGADPDADRLLGMIDDWALYVNERDVQGATQAHKELRKVLNELSTAATNVEDSKRFNRMRNSLVNADPMEGPTARISKAFTDIQNRPGRPRATPAPQPQAEQLQYDQERMQGLLDEWANAKAAGGNPGIAKAAKEEVRQEIRKFTLNPELHISTDLRNALGDLRIALNHQRATSPDFVDVRKAMKRLQQVAPQPRVTPPAPLRPKPVTPTQTHASSKTKTLKLKQLLDDWGNTTGDARSATRRRAVVKEIRRIAERETLSERERAALARLWDNAMAANSAAGPNKRMLDNFEEFARIRAETFADEADIAATVVATNRELPAFVPLEEGFTPPRPESPFRRRPTVDPTTFEYTSEYATIRGSTRLRDPEVFYYRKPKWKRRTKTNTYKDFQQMEYYAAESFGVFGDETLGDITAIQAWRAKKGRSPIRLDLTDAEARRLPRKEPTLNIEQIAEVSNDMARSAGIQPYTLAIMDRANPQELLDQLQPILEARVGKNDARFVLDELLEHSKKETGALTYEDPQLIVFIADESGFGLTLKTVIHEAAHMVVSETRRLDEAILQAARQAGDEIPAEVARRWDDATPNHGVTFVDTVTDAFAMWGGKNRDEIVENWDTWKIQSSDTPAPRTKAETLTPLPGTPRFQPRGPDRAPRAEQS